MRQMDPRASNPPILCGVRSSNQISGTQQPYTISIRKIKTILAHQDTASFMEENLKRNNYLKKIHSTNCLISAHGHFFSLKQSSHTKSLSDKATAATPFSQYENLPEPSAEQNCCRGGCRQNQHPFPCGLVPLLLRFPIDVCHSRTTLS